LYRGCLFIIRHLQIPPIYSLLPLLYPMMDFYRFMTLNVAAWIIAHPYKQLENIGSKHWVQLRKHLNPSEKDSFPCSLQNALLALTGQDFLSAIARADIVIEISFRPSFLLWKQTNRFRFITHRTNDGLLQWTPRSIE
jgi:hypothetical protein